MPDIELGLVIKLPRICRFLQALWSLQAPGGLDVGENQRHRVDQNSIMMSGSSSLLP